MKTLKKLLLISTLLLLPTKVFASDYKYSMTKIEATDDIEVKEEKLYKFYDEEITYTDDYYMEGENPKEYPYQSDIIISKITRNNLVKEEKKGRNIHEKEINAYAHLKKIKRIVIKDIYTEVGTRDINIKEIAIYNKNKKIDYNYYCVSCGDFTQYALNNDKYDDKSSYINYQSVLDIRLNEEYYPEDLKIVIYFKEYNKFKFNFNIYYYDNSVTCLMQSNAVYPRYDYIIKNVGFDTNNIKSDDYLASMNIKINKNDIVNYQFEEDIISLDKDPNYYYKELYNIKVYDYEDIMYKYYKKEKKYLKGYYKELEDYIKDEKDYIIRYKYRKIENKENKQISSIEQEEQEEKEKSYQEEKIYYNVDKNLTLNKNKDKIRHSIIVIIISVICVTLLIIYFIYTIFIKKIK